MNRTPAGRWDWYSRRSNHQTSKRESTGTSWYRRSALWHRSRLGFRKAVGSRERGRRCRGIVGQIRIRLEVVVIRVDGAAAQRIGVAILGHCLQLFLGDLRRGPFAVLGTDGGCAWGGGS